MARAAVRGRLTWQVATVGEVIDETAAARSIVLDLPQWPGHRAGQHLDIRPTAEDGYTAERPYSIASAPGEPVVITVERIDDGEVSPYLARELRPGDQLICADLTGLTSDGRPCQPRVPSAASLVRSRPCSAPPCCPIPPTNRQRTIKKA